MVKIATEPRQINLDGFSFPRDLESSYRSTIESWLSKLDPSDRETFAGLESDLALSCQRLTPGEIADRVLFREEVIHEEVLGKFDLSRMATHLGRTSNVKEASDPRHNNPVILVKNGEGDLLIVQGNHRTFAILERNPEEYPLFAVVFNSIDAYEKFTGMRVNRLPDGSWGTNNPRLDRLGIRSEAA